MLQIVLWYYHRAINTMNMPDEPGILTCVSLRYVAELFAQRQNGEPMNVRAAATAQEAAADLRMEQRGTGDRTLRKEVFFDSAFTAGEGSPYLLPLTLLPVMLKSI